MGACASAPRARGLSVQLGPVPAEVSLGDGQAPQKVGLASASLCYCLLAAPGNASVFIDTRPKESFLRSHVAGAWTLHSMLENLSTQEKERGPSESEAAALRSRCDLRWTVLLGGDANPLKDPQVLQVLRLLRQAGVRPTSQQALLLRGGMGEFSRRYTFCMRGKAQDDVLPPCPAEILEPGWAAGGRSRPPALYLGSNSCCSKGSVSVKAHPLKVLSMASVVRLVSPEDAAVATDLVRGIKLLNVHVARVSQAEGPTPVAPSASSIGNEEEAAADFNRVVAAAASAAMEACTLALQQSAPCMLCGPWSSVAAALCLSKVLPGPTRGGEELCALIKQRYPAADFNDAALAALNEALGHRQAASASSVRAAAAAGATNQPPSVQPVVLPRAMMEADMLCKQFRERLRHDRSSAEVTLGTIRTALEKVLAQPREERLRRLKTSNARVARELLPHPEAVALLKLAGFANDAAGDLVLPTASSLQALRDVLAGLPAASGKR
eukprot:TRINITY_DN28546_c0_g1_i1.p1 TRINITY_DN28546_c0_g1~~TRINITY_DN28546_c0_g1_i1.p1  ORF type:complete len:497 (+),score=108.39 TRINITY_DN28546_c0_g1_i1:66-1556(+)